MRLLAWFKGFFSDPPTPVYQTQRPLILLLGWERDADRYARDHQWTGQQRRQDIVCFGTAYNRQSLHGLSREILIVDNGGFWERAGSADRQKAYEVITEAKHSNHRNEY